MLKKILRSLLFVLITVLGVYGIVPNTFIPRANLSSYIVETYQYGIAINNSNEVFYNITPYNFTEDRNKYSGIFDWNEKIFAKEYNEKNKFKQIINSFYFSIGQATPTATFTNGTQYFVLSSKIIADKSLAIDFFTNKTSSKEIVQAISFNKDDFIVDENKNVLRAPEDTSQDTIDLYRFNALETNKINPGKKYIYIMNTKFSGAIRINLSNFKSVSIDNTRKLILLETLNGNNFLNIDAFTSLDEALQEEK